MSGGPPGGGSCPAHPKKRRTMIPRRRELKRAVGLRIAAKAISKSLLRWPYGIRTRSDEVDDSRGLSGLR